MQNSTETDQTPHSVASVLGLRSFASAPLMRRWPYYRLDIRVLSWRSLYRVHVHHVELWCVLKANCRCAGWSELPQFAYCIIEPQRRKTYLLTCAPNEDSDQPAIRVVVVHKKTLYMYIPCYPKCTQWGVWSDCTNAQAYMNLRWAHIYEGSFSDVADNFSLSKLVRLISHRNLLRCLHRYDLGFVKRKSAF